MDDKLRARQAHRKYLKVKMPSADAVVSNDTFLSKNVRFGTPEVWVVDEQGNEIEQVFGITGVSVIGRAGEFMAVTIDAIASVEF